ncbi:MAG TPA: hypothetical protein VEX11_01190 [Acetobacteraceae bacterium]|nr:hypothetical protein [Acetobacteraceae bacterium]
MGADRPRGRHHGLRRRRLEGRRRHPHGDRSIEHRSALVEDAVALLDAREAPPAKRRVSKKRITKAA